MWTERLSWSGDMTCPRQRACHGHRKSYLAAEKDLKKKKKSLLMFLRTFYLSLEKSGQGKAEKLTVFKRI